MSNKMFYFLAFLVICNTLLAMFVLKEEIEIKYLTNLITMNQKDNQPNDYSKCKREIATDQTYELNK